MKSRGYCFRVDLTPKLALKTPPKLVYSRVFEMNRQQTNRGLDGWKMHFVCDLFPISSSDCSRHHDDNLNLPAALTYLTSDLVFLFLSFFIFFLFTRLELPSPGSSLPWRICKYPEHSLPGVIVWLGEHCPWFKLLHVGHGHQLQKACSLSVLFKFSGRPELNVSKGGWCENRHFERKSTPTMMRLFIWRSHFDGSR